jgi:hypothetical protein
VDGFRIEPGEIEIALMAEPGVKEAVVIAPEVRGGGRQLVAYLVLGEDPGPTQDIAKRLRSALRQRLPEYMVPVRYMVLDRLPTTPSGKIDRKALPLPEAPVVVGDPDDPGSLVRAIWCDLLGRDQLGDDQNLFDLGARSLLVLRFMPGRRISRSPMSTTNRL